MVQLRLLIGLATGMVVMLFSWSSYLDLLFFGHRPLGTDPLSVMTRVYVSLTATVVMGVLGIPILRDALVELADRRLGVDFLIAMGAFAAYAVSLLGTLHGEEVYYDTATMILIFVTLGRYLEAKGKAQASAAIRSLKALVPQVATVLREEQPTVAPISEIKVGERVLVKPGEIIPVDGVVLEGSGNVNQATLTGESRPVMAEPGGRLLAGTMSLDGAFVLSVSALAGERVIARLVELAEEAKRIKPAVVALTERVAGVFAPTVIVLSLGALVFWSLRLGFVAGLFTALSVVLIACPCALGIATPLAFWTGLALAARRGILVRSGLILERLARVRQVFFDKTGTLTSGSFKLTSVICVAPGTDRRSALQIASSLESRSEHPIAAALCQAATQEGIAPLGMAQWKARPGIGVQARLEGNEKEFFLGSERMMREERIELGQELHRTLALRSGLGETVVYLGWQGRVRAAFSFAEEVRAEATQALKALREQRIALTILTGDEGRSAESLREVLRIEDVRWGLLPHEKVAAIRSSQVGPWVVAMVGDGINDAAALGAADVGIALGCGADVARQSGDIVMLSPGITQLPWLFDFARRVRRVVVTNLIWTFSYNLIGVAMALGAHLSPVLAAIAMVFSSLFVVGNTRRLYRAAASSQKPWANDSSDAEEGVGSRSESDWAKSELKGPYSADRETATIPPARVANL